MHNPEVVIHSLLRHIAVLVYVYGLILARNSSPLIDQTKKFLASSFHMKDLGVLRYFLGIEVNRSAQGIFSSHKKYTLDMIKESLE